MGRHRLWTNKGCAQKDDFMSYIMQPYDDSLREILANGVRKKNRTGIDTLSIFGIQTRYRIADRFPVLTGRRLWPKAIFAELLWVISGSTLNKDLQALDSNIWTPWVNAKFEKKNNYWPTALGPIYGFQLRHFGGEYGDGDTTHPWYGRNGFDQLTYMIELLKSDPDSRRNLFSLWNPNDLAYQKLPCCHYSFQVYVHEGNLSGMLTQRSADYPLGVCANLIFYSALLYMLAQQTGLEPYELIHSTADNHIYFNQIDAVEEYLLREKPDSPTLSLNKRYSIDSYEISDFKLVDYNPLAPIKIPVTV